MAVTYLRIEHLTEKRLMGQRLLMSLAQNKTIQLWQTFMPRRKEIQHRLSQDLFSMQVYNGVFSYNPNALFEKWAAVEVSDIAQNIEGMETYHLQGGMYAIFLHKGTAEIAARQTFEYIFNEWLPLSNYMLDERPHFEILGEKYKRNDENSEEEIWIPIKSKA